MAEIIGVDLGGTKVLVAAVDEDGTARGHVKHPTPTDGPAAVVDLIGRMVAEIDHAPAAVGVGVPGPVADDGTVVEVPNIPGWGRGEMLGDLLRERLGVPVALGNDANVGTLGEARHGAGVGSGSVLGCWLGTGVGGGLVLDGRLHTGVGGTAAELGHVPVTFGPHARICGCGRPGCLEAYAGRASMEARADELIAGGGDDLLHRLMADKGKDRLTSGVWKKAVEAEDPVATTVMDDAVAALAAALAGVVNLLDLNTIIFGGGLAEKLGQDHVDRIATATLPGLMAPDTERRWVVATLGDDAGVVGAAALARDLA